MQRLRPGSRLRRRIRNNRLRTSTSKMGRREDHVGRVLRVTEAGGEWVLLTAAGEVPEDTSSCKFYTASRLKLDVDFILNNIYVTVGDDILG